MQLVTPAAAALLALRRSGADLTLVQERAAMLELPRRHS